MKKIKPLKNSHTPNTKKGMGDFYGTGVKNPMAKSIEIMGMTMKPVKKSGTPPKSLA